MTATSGWYVYVDDSGHEWALRLPSAVGGHPALGFRPLDGQHLPVLQNGRQPLRYTRVGAVRPRHVGLCRSRHPSGVGLPEYKSLPVGTRDAFTKLPKTLTLTGADGLPIVWTVTGARGESVTLSRLPAR